MDLLPKNEDNPTADYFDLIEDFVLISRVLNNLWCEKLEEEISQGKIQPFLVLSYIGIAQTLEEIYRPLFKEWRSAGEFEWLTMERKMSRGPLNERLADFPENYRDMLYDDTLEDLAFCDDPDVWNTNVLYILQGAQILYQTVVNSEFIESKLRNPDKMFIQTAFAKQKNLLNEYQSGSADDKLRVSGLFGQQLFLD